MYSAGIFDWANDVTAQGTVLVKSVVFLACIVMVVFTAVKTKMAIASVLMTAAMAAFVIWAVTMDGLGWFANGIGEETSGMGTSTSLIEHV